VDATNKSYSDRLSTVRTSLEAIVQLQSPQSDTDRAHLQEFLATLSTLEEGARESLTAIGGMADMLRSIPSAERTSGRARDKAVVALHALSDNIEQTISMVARIRDIAHTKLQESVNR